MVMGHVQTNARGGNADLEIAIQGPNGKGKGANGAVNGVEASVEDTDSVLSLREAGLIRPLEDVYTVAEKQLGGRVLDAKLVGNVNQGWDYDLRVVTEDGHVHQARYDAATLALRTLDGQPVE